MDRRTMLGALGAGTVALSGCLSGSDDTDNTEDTGNGADGDNESELEDTVFDSVGYDGLEFYVAIEEDADVDTVELVSGGESAGSFTYGPGVTRNSIEISESAHGTVEFIATKDGEEVDSVEKTFAPELTVTEIGRVEGETIGKDSEYFDSEYTEFPEMRSAGDARELMDAEVVIENTGNAPAFVTERGSAAITEGVPLPRDEEELAYYEDGDDYGNPLMAPDKRAIPSGESVTTSALGELGINAWNPADYRPDDAEWTEMEDWCGSTKTATVVIYDDTGFKHSSKVELSYDGELIYWVHSSGKEDAGIGSCETIRTN